MTKSVPSVSVTFAQNRSSTTTNELGMRKMQERAYEMRGEQYLLIKSPPASDENRKKGGESGQLKSSRSKVNEAPFQSSWL